MNLARRPSGSNTLSQRAELNERVLAELLKQAKALLQEKLAQEVERHDFTAFFHTHEVRAGDALLVTMQPAEQTYVFAHEPAAQANTALIAARDWGREAFGVREVLTAFPSGFAAHPKAVPSYRTPNASRYPEIA